MAEQQRRKVAGAIFRFLHQAELNKAAKALLKDAKKKGWDLEVDEECQIDLLKVCFAEEKESHSEATVSMKVKRSYLEDGEEAVQRDGKKQRQKDQPTTKTSGGAVYCSDKNANKKKGSKQAASNAANEAETLSATEKNCQPTEKGIGHKEKLRRFQRVDDSQWTAKLPNNLRDNSFWSKKSDDFAVKAAEQLGKVRGRDFRHEKTKKKKASWKGCGEIPMTVNSIQFNSDSD